MADTRRARSVAAASEARGAREEEGGRVDAGRAACAARGDAGRFGQQAETEAVAC
jgi:hypothetical protein